MGRWGWIAALCLWVVAVSATLALLHRHASLAGDVGSSSGRWPATSSIRRVAGRGTLLVFVHPYCPCTRASVRALEGILSRAGTQALEVRVLFREEPGDHVEEAVTWSMAARVPGAQRLRDPGGAEAARFGARTSGLVLFFDAAGVLRFRGGVTPSRGHEGDSVGAASLESALRGGGAGTALAQVFGCEMFGGQAR